MRQRIKMGLLAGGILLLAAGCGNSQKENYEEAKERLEAGSYEEAIQGFSQVIGQGEFLLEAYRGQGIAHLRLGQYVEAAKAFEEALSTGEGGRAFRHDILLYQATAQYQGEMMEAAGETCAKALELRDDAPTLYLNGKVRLELDQYEEAAESFSRAYEKESTYRMAIDIYQAYLVRGMEADGTAYLEKVLAKSPKDAEDYCRRGEIYTYMKDYDRAQEELIQAVNDGSQEGKLLLGNVYFRKGELTDARVMYQEYVADMEGAVDGYNGLALCDLEEQDYAGALDNIEKGLRIAQGEDAKGLLFNQIVVFERQQEYGTALSKVEDYLRLFPGEEKAEKEKIFLQTRLGLMAQAAGEEQEADGEGAAQGSPAGSGENPAE